MQEIVPNFVAANNQELGSRFHSLTIKTRIDIFKSSFPSLFVFLFVSFSKIKSRIPSFDVSLCLYHNYDAICTVEIKALLRNF